MSLTEGVVCKRKACREIEELTQKEFSIISDEKEKNNNKEDDHSQKKVKRYGLVSFKELPGYMKDNEFILDYYRANWPLIEALFSILRWHNETLNVWTHLIGFVLFLVLTMANLNLLGFSHQLDVELILEVEAKAKDEDGDEGGAHDLWSSLTLSSDTSVSHNDKYLFMGTTKLINLQQITSSKFDIKSGQNGIAQWPFFVFLGGSMFCLLSSSICHLFSCHSHSLNILLLRVDYVGITTMIITSFFPPIYYIFQCDSNWHLVYLGGITIMGIFTIVTLLSPQLSTGKFRAFRALLFASMGLFGIVPAIHAVIVNCNNPRRNITLVYELGMAVFYLTGTAFYVSRIPERLKPGWFDLAGHSHQIFHVFVVMGALAHYAATLVILDWRNTFGCHISI